MIGLTAKLSLVVRGPLLIHASEIGPWGVDAVAMRDAQNHLTIPGDVVRGKIRESMDELGKNRSLRSRKEDIQQSRAEATSGDVPPHLDAAVNSANSYTVSNRRYPVQFSDFVSVDAFPLPGVNTVAQIEINSQTGSTADGSLRILDAPLKSGEQAQFIGQIRFLQKDAESANRQLDDLVTSLSWVRSLGSHQSVGFGKVINVDVVKSELHQFAATTTTTAVMDDHCISGIVDFEFQDAICFPDGVANGNIFESQTQIAGEAIKGAVAGLLIRLADGDTSSQSFPNQAFQSEFPYSNLCRCFSSLRITTARCRKQNSASTGLPPVIPLSLAVANERVFDLAVQPPEQVNDLFEGHAPAFLPDWKFVQENAVKAALGITSPSEELRVHTAIDSQIRRAADSQLFAYRSLRTQGLCWRATVSIAADEDVSRNTEDAFRELISLLESGWLNVSKTKARGSGRLVRQHTVATPTPITIGGQECFVITLRGPTVMLDPRKCVDTEGCMISSAEYHQLFHDYWNEVSNGTLLEIPSRRFKKDRLIGGFQGRRYRFSVNDKDDLRKTSDVQKRIKEQANFPYNPTLVVEAGSVFVLAISDGSDAREAASFVEHWMRHGLPLPEWALKAYGDTHHTNIFLRENGYGEIDVNLSIHQSSYQSPLLKLNDESR